MKKILGQQGRLMGMEYVRVMPQAQLQTVGSFFLLDHFFERKLPPQELGHRNTGAHPHRGITTLTYIIKGKNEHLDSMGNHAVVDSASVQWMKAGRGIVHDEGAPEDFQASGGDLHMMQFWLLLRDDNRDDDPHYLPLRSDDVPEKVLDERGSVLRILLGEYCSAASPLPLDTDSFLYHLVLKPGSVFYYTIPEGNELALLAAKGEVWVNNELLPQSGLMASDATTDTVEITNQSAEPVDVMLFGGEPYGEPFYSNGPFVMKDYAGIVQAYQDLEAGKYGELPMV